MTKMRIDKYLIFGLLLLINISVYCQDTLYTDLENLGCVRRIHDNFILTWSDYGDDGYALTSKLILTNFDFEIQWEYNFEKLYQNNITIIHHNNHKVFLYLTEGNRQAKLHYIVEISLTGELISKTLIDENSIESGGYHTFLNYNNKLHFTIRKNEKPYYTTYDISNKQIEKIKLPCTTNIFPRASQFKIYENKIILLVEEYTDYEKFSAGVIDNKMTFTIVEIDNKKTKILNTFSPKRHYSIGNMFQENDIFSFMLNSNKKERPQLFYFNIKGTFLHKKIMKYKDHTKFWGSSCICHFNNNQWSTSRDYNSYSGGCMNELSFDGEIIKTICNPYISDRNHKSYMIDDEIYVIGKYLNRLVLKCI